MAWTTFSSRSFEDCGGASEGRLLAHLSASLETQIKSTGTSVALTATPSLSDYFTAANAAYLENAAPAGYILLTSKKLDQLNENDDGFHAVVFKSTTTSSIIISFEGSTPGLNVLDPYTLASNANDAQLLLGLIPDALDDAIGFALEVQAEFGSIGSLYLTGHSLGGAEAEAVARASSGLGFTIAGGATFGAPGLPGWSGDNDPSNFKNYIDYGDPIANYASDTQSALNTIAPENMNHFGEIDFIGSEFDTTILVAAAVTARWVTNYAWLAFAPMLQHHRLYSPSGPSYGADLGYSVGSGLDLSYGNLAPVLAAQGAAHVQSAPSTHPTITGITERIAQANSAFAFSSICSASEAPAGSGHFIDHYTIGYVRGPGELIIAGHAYSGPALITDVTPGQFASIVFSSGASSGEAEIAVIAFDDAGNSSNVFDTVIDIVAPPPASQPADPGDHTAPSIAPNGPLTTGVGSKPTLSSAYLEATDNYYSSTQLTYTVVSAPSHGYILKNGSIVSTFTQYDVDNGLIEYQENGTISPSDSFVYFVTDASGNRTLNHTLSIQIDAPVSSTTPLLTTNSALSVGEGLTSVIGSQNLAVSDAGLQSWQIIYTVTGVPAHGQILADGVIPVTSFTQQQVDLGLISYHSDGTSGADPFTFTVTDAAGSTIGATQFDINVIPHNNLSVSVSRPIFTDPIGQFFLHNPSDGGIPIGSTGYTTFTATPGLVTLVGSDLLSAIDPGVDPSNITYTVSDMSTNYTGLFAYFIIGTWDAPTDYNSVNFSGRSFDQFAIDHGQPHSFTQAEINSGQVFVRYTGPALGNGTPYGQQFAITVSASDNAGNSLGNIVLPVVVESDGVLHNGVFSTAGQSQPAILAAPIGQTATVGSGIVTAVSPQFADNQLLFQIGIAPAHGAIMFDGVAVTGSATFTQKDIDSGRIAYVQDGSVVSSDSFVLWERDPNNPGHIRNVIPFDVEMTGTQGGLVLTGHSGSETISPGFGNNFLLGDGDTIASYSNAPNGISANLAQGIVINGYGGTDTLTNIHAITGSSHNDAIASNGAHDDLRGGAGNDTFEIIGALKATEAIAGSSGSDTIRLDVDTNVHLHNQTIKDVEGIILVAGHSYKLITADSNVAKKALLTVDGSSMAATDNLSFDGAHETNGRFDLRGGDGSDSLTGGSRDDLLSGGGRADVLTGGSGDDQFIYAAVENSTSKQFDTVIGFDANSDAFDVWFHVKGVDAAVIAGTLRAAHFDSDLAAAVDGAHLQSRHAVVFTPTGGTYAGDTFLIVDANGVAGYQPGQDLVIKLDHALNLSSLARGDFS